MTTYFSFNTLYYGVSSSWGLLGCNTVYCCGRIPNFQRSVLPPSSGWSGSSGLWNIGILP